MVETDIHLGYKENDEERNDTFETFDEVLSQSNKNDVDFILLAGDLFHNSIPNLTTMLPNKQEYVYKDYFKTNLR